MLKEALCAFGVDEVLDRFIPNKSLHVSTSWKVGFLVRVHVMKKTQEALRLQGYNPQQGGVMK